MEIDESKNKIEQLLELTVEELLDLLPNNICLGKGAKLEPMGFLEISKCIDNSYHICYIGGHNQKTRKEQTLLFEVSYCKSLKLGLIETYFIVKSLLKKQAIAEISITTMIKPKKA